MPQKPDLAKREEWQRRLQEFERENTTIVEFCRRVGVPVWSFYYWRQRIQSGTIATVSDPQRHKTATPTQHARLVHRPRQAAAKPRLKFLPIQISGQLTVEVHLPNGTRVTVPCQDHDAIGVVIAALVNDSPERRTC